MLTWVHVGEPAYRVLPFAIQGFESERSTECLESIPRHRPTRDTSDVGFRESRSRQLVEAVEGDRYSLERLVEIEEISKEPGTPAHGDAVRSLDSERRPKLLAVGNTDMSVNSHSPVPSVVLTSLAPLPATFLQTFALDQLSVELVWFRSRPPDDGGLPRRRHDAVNLSFSSTVGRHSPKLLVVPLPPISKLVSQTNSCHIQSIQGWWRVRSKPPNAAVLSQSAHQPL